MDRMVEMEMEMRGDVKGKANECFVFMVFGCCVGVVNVCVRVACACDV